VVQAWKRLRRRHTSKDMKDYLAGEASWRTAQEQAPPLGVKLLLLNPGGTCVIGTWGDWAKAWAPLPKVPEHIKQLLLERNT
jgi:hypothetical protein